MSKETTEVKEETTPVVKTKQSTEVINVEALSEQASKMEVSSEELVTNYFDFTIGESIRVLPLGLKRIQKMNPSQQDWDGKRENEDKPMVNAIRFLNTDDQQFYISADAVVVSSLEDYAVSNAEAKNNGKALIFFEMTCIGESSSTKGKYKNFSVKPLI